MSTLPAVAGTALLGTLTWGISNMDVPHWVHYLAVFVSFVGLSFIFGYELARVMNWCDKQRIERQVANEAKEREIYALKSRR